jgi:membrane protein
MRSRRLMIWPLLKQTVREWNEDNCIRLGASLSYYMLFSVFPLILVVLAIIRLLLVNSDAARNLILEGLSSVTGGFRDEFVATLEAAMKSRRSSGIIGTATLILGASWVLGELVSAFRIIWDEEAPARGGPGEWLRSSLFTFALLLAIVFLLLVSMVINAALTALTQFASTMPGGRIIGAIVQWVITLGVLTGVFALLFKYLPRTRIAWGDVWLGAALTALSWSILQYAISLYITLSSYKNYGAVGSILALVAWVYLSSQVLFLGGEFTSVYARWYGSRSNQAPPATTADDSSHDEAPSRVAAQEQA